MIPHKRNEAVTRWFSWYARRAFLRNFRRVWLTRSSRVGGLEEGVPAVGVLNHSSWWDALLVLWLGRYVFKREYYGVFDEEQLRRYGIFRLIGAYSVNRHSAGEYRAFLKYSEALLKGRSRLLWIFPQGDIVSNDRLPLEFKKGFASIVSRLGKVQLVKIVASYDFWLDSRPEIVLDVMPPETVTAGRGAAFADALAERVAAEMTGRLALVRDIVRERDVGRLEPLLTAGHGTNPVYDAWRRAKAWSRGEKFERDHAVISA